MRRTCNLKSNGWKMIFPFGMVYFQGLVSGRVIFKLSFDEEVNAHISNASALKMLSRAEGRCTGFLFSKMIKLHTLACGWQKNA